MIYRVEVSRLRPWPPEPVLSHQKNLQKPLDNSPHKVVYAIIMVMDQSAPKLELPACQAMGRCCLAFNLRRADRAVMQVYDEEVRALGLRVTQFGLLMVARVMEPVTLSQLSEFLGLDRTTLSRNLKPLVKRRWVRVEAGEDRRERKLSLTEEGHGLLVKAHPAWAKAQAKIAKAFGQAEMEQLVGQLRKVTAAIRPG